MAASDSYDPWFDEITLRVAQDATEGQGQASNKAEGQQRNQQGSQN